MITLSLGQYLVVAALIMIGSIVVTFRKMVRRRLAVYLRRESPRIVDVIRSDIDMPVPTQIATRTLEELGFQLYAVSETHSPHLNTVGITWHYINSEKDVNAEVNNRPNRAVVQFTTWYDDHTLVETSCPIGENFSTKDYCSQFTQRNIPDAYAIQREQMRKFTGEKHRRPSPNRSLDEYIQREKIYQQNYKYRKFLPGLLRGLGSFAAFNLGMVVALIAVAGFTVPSLQIEDMKLFSKSVTTFFGLAVAAFLYLKRKHQYHSGG